MATRMQQRRGTAAQWISTNGGAGPVLNAGEMGWESDTNKFKIGDGVNNWTSLDYFSDINSTVDPAFGSSITFEGTTANAFETTLTVTDPTADRTITIPDVTGTVITTGNLSDITNIGVFTSTITMEGSSADDFELTLSAGNPTADRTITFPDATGTVALTTDITASNLANDSITAVKLAGDSVTTSKIQNLAVETGKINDLAVTTGKIAEGAVTSGKIADGTIVDGDINAAAAIAQSKISGLTTDLGLKAPLASPTFTGTVTVPTPTNSTDAATKAYVDAVSEGLHIHASVVAATTANITLATDVENGDTLDGVTLATGNRILVKNQSTTSQNGIYVVAASGAPSRAADFDSPAEIDGGDFVFVTGGTANDNKGFVQINIVGTVGTDPIEFTQFSGAGTFVAGNGLTLTDNSFSINTATTADLSTAQTLTNKTLGSAIATTALTLNATAELRLADTDSTHYVGFKSPATVSTNRIWTLPSADGTANQVLKTDGSGTLSWATAGGGGAAFSELMLIGA
jgi:hypothetical protein